jgi:SNF2 family DNA or RNA helicase
MTINLMSSSWSLRGQIKFSVQFCLTVEFCSSLENVMMQMRKCCNHPYLFEAPVDDEGNWIIDNRLIECSGKMKLLDNMLKVTALKLG